MNRLLFGFSILTFFSLVAWMQMASADPFCELTPPITIVQKQQNSAWCWAASTTLVINHLDPQRRLKQCTVVQNTIASGREDIDCCLVTDEAMGTANTRDPKVINSLDRCHTINRPENALEANGYTFHRIKYFPFEPGTDPYNQGLDWSDLTAQICSNRPIISVKAWDDGGTHSEVITGFHRDPDASVDVDTHGMDGFYTESFQDYRGEPGVSKHVRDYIDIHSIGQ